MPIAFRLISAVCVVLFMALAAGIPSARIGDADTSSLYRLSPTALADKPLTFTVKAPTAAPIHINGQAHAATGMPGFDTIPTFNGHFHLTGYDRWGNLQSHWYTNTVGHMPADGGTTTIGAPVIPVSVELLDANGNQDYDPASGTPLYYDATQYMAQVLNSPLFQPLPYSSSATPTQYTDAIQRAEYYRQAPADWHTLLAPRLAPPRVVQIPRGQYYYALNDDGTCCAWVALDDGDLTFTHAFYHQAILPSIVDGSVTEQDISSFIFPNTLLYLGSLRNCCYGGYHDYTYQSASLDTNNLTLAWVVNFSSWLTRPYFAPNVDTAVLSHELAETFNDPFVTDDDVHNVVPWYEVTNRYGTFCSDLLEVGDVVNGLPHEVYTVALNGMTYHVQNVALRQWFEGDKSDAIGGAYSYPDTTILTTPMVPTTFQCQ